MYIRNGQNVSKFSEIKKIDDVKAVRDIKEINNINDVKERDNFRDSSEKILPKPEILSVEIASDSRRYKNRRKILNRRTDKKYAKKYAEDRTNGLTKYLYDRKYFILLFSVIYITGLIIGAILIKNVENDEIIVLRTAVDSHFTDISSAAMISRIINNISVGGLLLGLTYLSGVTVFAPVVCAVVCIYKGISCGYIMGVYISGGADLFHIQICCLTFVFYLLIMLCFILLFSESTGFSVFLLKNRESYRESLSFANIISYSSRYILLTVLALLLTILQIIAISVIYSI